MIQYLSDYEAHLKARGFQASSIQQICFQIKSFLNYLLAHGEESLTLKAVTRYRDYLDKGAKDARGKTLSPRLIARRLQALKGFGAYLVCRKVFLLNPARELVSPKPERLPQYVPSDEAISQMMSRIPTSTLGVRDKAMLETLYSAGLRASELIQLHLYDIDFETKRLLIRKGKGAKDRVLPLGRYAEASLRDYLETARPSLIRREKTTALFLTRSGKPIRYPVLNHLIRRTRTSPLIRPHSIRHACAVGMMKNGADIRFIQELLGHERLESTQIYTQLYPSEVKAAHARFHPRRFTPRELKEVTS